MKHKKNAVPVHGIIKIKKKANNMFLQSEPERMLKTPEIIHTKLIRPSYSYRYLLYSTTGILLAKTSFKIITTNQYKYFFLILQL